jgi:hypothetical protein
MIKFVEWGHVSRLLLWLPHPIEELAHQGEGNNPATACNSSARNPLHAFLTSQINTYILT